VVDSAGVVRMQEPARPAAVPTEEAGAVASAAVARTEGVEGRLAAAPAQLVLAAATANEHPAIGAHFL
jgi:hypothetical protein